MKRCLVVDDEKPAREELIYILKEIEGIEVIGQASHGKEALQLIDRFKPDIVFLDIQMPEMNGIEVARKLLNKEYTPEIIFVTAYDKFAVQAFEVNAIDYLLKPISEDRLKQRLESMVKEDKHNESLDYDKLKALICSIKPETADKKMRISFHQNNRLIPVDIEDIIYITIENKSTIIFTSKGNFDTNHTLNELMDKLDNNVFFRSHKSYIVNLNYIEFIDPWFNYTYNIHLKNSDAIIPVSRSYVKDFKEIMNIE
ncbi:LytTR family DNA-binding domain-containing protein [Tissierella pigra]|uniref:LytR/AlgR family response regulator transcription factor n=1 Tax=Tissierella pigra TaxID=2607614 RepID=UPI001C0F5075|nr:LytTR family DNA-binding domain-containing protein [Tissierella pigra]MBU5424864.1 LytTR family DNA-binding domain-containing protein [Tissierella pigra]